MPLLAARWLAPVLLALLAGVGWYQWGQTVDALQEARTARIRAEQALQVERVLVAELQRREAENAFLAESIRKGRENDPESQEWASVVIPAGERQRLQQLY